MLSVGQLNEGVVLDHIPAGKAMDIYRKLKLNQMDCQVAMIMQARSSKMGLKDIIKVECPLELLNLDALGFIDHTITVNIIRYGFGMDSRRHNIDVRLILREGESLIRIRDDCANFDPVHYLELHRQDNPGAHLGIRMVMAAARDASYLNSYGLNNLTLRL